MRTTKTKSPSPEEKASKKYDLDPKWTESFDRGERVATVFNGTYTVENVNTGNHRTFEIKTRPRDSNFAPGKRVVALLNGPDNEKDYIGFAFMGDDGITVWRSKRGTAEGPSLFDKYARLLWALTTEGENCGFYKQGFRLHSEGRCIRCNRKLTVPESIKTGIGPVCAGR
jgi:hypothetical protein